MKKFQIAALILFSLCGCAEQESANKKLDEKDVKVGVMVTDSPKTVGSNTEFTVTVLVRNLGEQTLPAANGGVDAALQVNVTYHWLSLDGKPLIWDGLRTPLGRGLKKSDDREVKLTVRAPPTPDNYVLEVDLVQEEVFWFGGVGSQTARMIISVQ